MRIGIDYRMTAQGNSVINRGVGRYTQQQLREVLRLDTTNEYILFCYPHANTDTILPEIRSAPNTQIAYINYPSLKSQPDPHVPEYTLQHTAEFMDWIGQQNIDVYHLTIPFMYHQNVTPFYFDVCPTVVTIYDLIPFIFPDKYLLPGHLGTELYFRVLNSLKSADRLVAISESARQDAVHYLGYPEDRIDLAYPIADPCFRVLEPELVQDHLHELNSRVKIPEKFILSVSYLHHTKNLQALLEGYSLLPATVRHELPLLLTFQISDTDQSILSNLFHRLNIDENIIMTNFVSDDELAALYNKATMVVHPSLYEGFGLPVVEAMRCGTPIITTTSSSLPEVGGDAAILVDPLDPEALAGAMIRIYEDPALREAMRQKGLVHSQTFSPTQLGQNTLDSYYKAIETAKDRHRPDRPRIAMWTPLPINLSNVTSNKHRLLDNLAASAEIEVFVDDGYLPPIETHNFTIKHFSAFARLHTQRPFDVIFYQLGATSEHFYMTDAIQKWPGVVVAHDLIWGWDLFQAYKQEGAISKFLELLARLGGQKIVKELTRLLKKDDWPGIKTFFNSNSLLKTVIESSLAQVVPMERAKQDMSSQSAKARVFTIHQGIKDPWQGLPLLRPQLLRDELGVHDETFLIGIMGNADSTQQLNSVIKAVARSADYHPDTSLVILGMSLDANYHLQIQKMVEGLGPKQAIRLISDVDHKKHDDWLLACDTVINLSATPDEQTLTRLIQAIAAGKPLIISDLPHWSDLPDSFCFRVPADEREVDSLAKYLQELLENPERRKQLSVAARDYFEQHNTIPHMANAYLKVAEKVTGRSFFANTSYQTRKVTEPMVSPNFNKVCEIEDFEDPELIEVVRDVFSHELRHFTPDFPKGAEYRKYWEIAMGVRALKRFGKLHADARILGVAAGTETTSFYLANHVGLVFATDLYLNPGVWGDFAPGFMLYEPEKVAPYSYDKNRLIVQHMDGRLLNYPDNTFDGIFSSSSIEHFGSMDLIANAAYEMGRVLKPGGILTLATEYIVSGPPGGAGWEGLCLFSREALLHYVVEASGLELVDELDTTISDKTLQTERDLSLYIDELIASAKKQGRYPRVGEVVWSVYPHILLAHNGYVFTSVHLTLRKPDNYPVMPNDWAKPDQKTIKAVRDLNLNMKRDQAPTAPISQGASSVQIAETNPLLQPTLEVQIQRLNKLRNRVNLSRLNRLPGPLAFFARTLIRIRQLGFTSDIQAESLRTVSDYLGDLEQRGVSLSQRQALLDARVEELEQTLQVMQERLDTQLQDFSQLSDKAKSINFKELNDKLEQRVRLNTSYVRMLQQQFAMLAYDEETGLYEKIPFSGNELVQLIRKIEKIVAPLATAGAVDISIQGSAAEDRLIEAAQYFDDRLSSKPSIYRAPNDAWYHVDFTSNWDRPALFDNAAIRLAPGGHFILFTSNVHTTAPAAPALNLVLEQQMQMTPSQDVYVYIWQKPNI